MLISYLYHFSIIKLTNDEALIESMNPILEGGKDLSTSLNHIKLKKQS